MNKKRIIVILSFVLILVIGKVLWVRTANKDIGSFKTEYPDLLSRGHYMYRIAKSRPQDLLDEMPAILGPQFQGEWALYTCSMLSAAYANMSILYPGNKGVYIDAIYSIITNALTPELRAYDTERWGEDALETLDGDISHISYLSHIAWMISAYKQAGGLGHYDKLYTDICNTMNRRILESPTLNLQTYPREYIYVPDMLVAIAALANYSRQNNGEYWSTVKAWVDEIKENWIDENSGMIMSYIPDGEVWIGRLPAVGSYSALSCYYLTFVDEKFAYEQYELLKKNFYKDGIVCGFKEYYNKNQSKGFNIDAGPVIFQLSPTGTAFAIGPATYFKDWEVRKELLTTAEIAGSTVGLRSSRHYLLGNIALVGEAITLAMRTAVKWE